MVSLHLFFLQLLIIDFWYWSLGQPLSLTFWGVCQLVCLLSCTLETSSVDHWKLASQKAECLFQVPMSERSMYTPLCFVVYPSYLNNKIDNMQVFIESIEATNLRNAAICHSTLGVCPTSWTKKHHKLSPCKLMTGPTQSEDFYKAQP